MSTWYVIPSDSDLIHHGVKGQRWGVRNQVYKPRLGVRKRGYSGPTNSAYQSNKKNGTSSAIKKKSNAENSAQLNSVGASAIAAGCTEEELREFEEIYAKILSGEITYDNISEYDIDMLDKVMYRISKMGKTAYKRFEDRVIKDEAAYNILREIGYGIGPSTVMVGDKNPALAQEIENRRRIQQRK